MEVAPDAHLPRPTRSLEYERGINTPICHLLRVTARGWFRTCFPRSRTRDKDLGAVVYLRRGPLRARKLPDPVPGLGPSGSPWGPHRDGPQRPAAGAGSWVLAFSTPSPLAEGCCSGRGQREEPVGGVWAPLATCTGRGGDEGPRAGPTQCPLRLRPTRTPPCVSSELPLFLVRAQPSVG